MKKLMIASAIALMCFSANAFAEDDGYGNDIPTAREEGTVDDGYGNKLPSSGESEFKSFTDARSSSNGNSQSRQLNIGGHFGFGLGTYWDYPVAFGSNDWFGMAFDLGGVLKYRVNDMLAVVPELNIGFIHSSRKVAEGYWYGAYNINETRLLVNLNIPVTARFTPVPYAYLEAGLRMNFNFATGHSKDASDQSTGQTFDSENLDTWEVKTFVPSVVAGLGGTIKVKNHEMDLGLRLNLDVSGIQKDNKYYGMEDNSKIWNIQFVLNYYLY